VKTDHPNPQHTILIAYNLLTPTAQTVSSKLTHDANATSRPDGLMVIAPTPSSTLNDNELANVGDWSAEDTLSFPPISVPIFSAM
jgi:hypothetical protein